MKKILFLLSLLTLFSCSELMPGNGTFMVANIDERKTETLYQLVQVKGRGQTWFYDERGKYHVGDTLKICIK